MEFDEGILEKRREYSLGRLKSLTEKINAINVVPSFPGLCVFATGSYARHEASIHSDLDLFFLVSESIESMHEPRTKSLRLFGQMIDIVEEMGFPKFSNDCRYLELAEAEKLIKCLGSPEDDFNNHFTARMLLLLESKCLVGQETYDGVVDAILNYYFKDYETHKNSFDPKFLMNDIGRYWKTLLLNYEAARQGSAVDEEDVWGRVKNFKLKFSRLTTCYATIIALASHDLPVRKQDVLNEIARTPIERLAKVAERIPETSDMIRLATTEYEWFLEQTGLSQSELEAKCAVQEEWQSMISRANAYGDSIFEIIKIIDLHQANKGRTVMRYLVI